MRACRWIVRGDAASALMLGGAAEAQEKFRGVAVVAE